MISKYLKITNKPIKTIIYTHYHYFDHTCGADIFAKRTAKQFGTGLSDEEILSLGIAPINDNNGKKAIYHLINFLVKKN